MAAKKSKKINLKFIVLPLLALIVVGTAGYKYYEWNTLNSLSANYNKTWSQELEMASTYHQTGNKLLDILNESNETEEASQENADKALTQTTLLIDQVKQTQETLKKNKEVYEKTNTALLMGDKKKFADEVKKVQLEYYKQEEASLERSLATLYFLHNLFTVTSDGLTIKTLEANAGGNPAGYGEHIGDIAVLKKYTEDSYAYPHQEEVKEHLPKAYDVLSKFKDFYAIFYEVVEDFAKGDQESAGYKAAKMQELAVELTIDPEDLMREGIEKDIENSKELIAKITKQTQLIKDFEDKGIPTYPLLPGIKSFEENVVLCQLYAYKTLVLHYNMLEEYPTASNKDELFKQLNAIAPRTNELDKRFDKNSMTFSNSEEKISFVCSDTSKENKYTFESSKYDQE